MVMIKTSLATVLFCTCLSITAQQSSDTTEIPQLLEDYKEAINRADTALAKTFWFTDPEVSLIHPKGHERGWEEVKKRDIWHVRESVYQT